MKYKFSIIVLIFSIFCFSQELKYEEVVPVDTTVTKQELYNRARSWFADSFKSEKDVMSIDDKEQGEISGNGAIKYDNPGFYFAADCTRGYIMFKINVYVKDGRYKYNLHSFTHEGSSCVGGPIRSYGLITLDKDPVKGAKKGWREVQELSKSSAERMITSLKKAMSKPHETSNDW